MLSLVVTALAAQLGAVALVYTSSSIVGGSKLAKGLVAVYVVVIVILTASGNMWLRCVEEVCECVSVRVKTRGLLCRRV